MHQHIILHVHLFYQASEISWVNSGGYLFLLRDLQIGG